MSKIMTWSVPQALAGKTGRGIYRDKKGDLVLGSYSPQDFLGTSFPLFNEIDTTLSFESVVSLANNGNGSLAHAPTETLILMESDFSEFNKIPSFNCPALMVGLPPHPTDKYI